MEKVPNIEDLIDKYSSDLLRLCFLYLKDKHMAEDALQDTFIKVYTNYLKFNNNSSEKTWITRIAINVCKNYHRKYFWKHINESMALNSIPAEDDVLYEDDTVIVEIMKLKTKYRECILLFYYENFKISEIAKILEIPEGTAAVRLKRGRDLLSKKLKGWYYDD